VIVVERLLAIPVQESAFSFDFLLEEHDGVEKCLGCRRASWHVHIHWNDTITTANNGLNDIHS
jgi:hypothetical protein